jgi:putative transcriptional regulator
MKKSKNSGGVFASLKRGLEEAIAHAKGEPVPGMRVTELPADVDVDVAALRRRIGLSQEQFAAGFGIKVATLRNWEQGRTEPDGPAKVLLRVIERDPTHVHATIWPSARSGPAARARRRQKAA